MTANIPDIKPFICLHSQSYAPNVTHKVAAVHLDTVNRVTLVRDDKGIHILHTFFEAVTLIKS